MNNVRYIIFPANKINLIDFNKILQSGVSSLRHSLDRKHVILKYVGEQPDFVYIATGDAIGLQEYTQQECINLLKGNGW